MQIYVQLGLAAAIALGLVYIGLQSMKPAQVQGFSLDDDDGTPKAGGGKAVSKKAKAKVKAPTRDQKIQGKKDAIVEGILKKADDKASGTSDALFKELDQKGPFPLDAYGVMDCDSFVKFRRIIQTHQFKRFIARKEELLAKRLEHYKAERFVEYKKLIQQAGVEYQTLGIQTTKDACDHIGMEEKNYLASFKAAEAKPAALKQIQEDEANIRLNAEPPRDKTFTREQIKKYHMEKAAAEFEAEKKMATTTVSSQQELMGLMMVERTKIMDELYLKYDVKLTDLMKGYKEHDLENDADVKTQVAAFAAEKKKIVDDIKKAEGLSDEQIAVCKEVVDGSGAVSETPGVAGVLDYNDLMKITSALIRLTIRFMKEKNVDYLSKRRELLQSGNEQEYAKFVAEYLKRQGIVKNSVMEQLFKGFNIEPEIFQRSSQYYRTNPEHSKKFQDDI